MKKTMIILVSIALVLILLVVGLLTGLFLKLNPDRGEIPSLEDYLAENWKIFRLRSWDEETGALELEYPLRFTFAQMEKYGASMEELRELPTGNLSTVTSLKTAAWEVAKVKLHEVTVYGITSDEQIAYTVYADGSITACWDGKED
ncbi:MAG: hypothetical protein J5789_05075 [Oscillospiraceae bacterium]|nr:hypothetical protein [Oscillospiraceae bacterium]